MNIYTLSSAIYSALPDGYNTTVTNGTCLQDTIKVTKDNSHIAMYIGCDDTAMGVLNASIYDESSDEEDELIEDGIYWDTENGATIETIANNIVKHIHIHTHPHARRHTHNYNNHSRLTHHTTQTRANTRVFLCPHTGHATHNVPRETPQQHARQCFT